MVFALRQTKLSVTCVYSREKRNSVTFWQKKKKKKSDQLCLSLSDYSANLTSFEKLNFLQITFCKYK